MTLKKVAPQIVANVKEAVKNSHRTAFVVLGPRAHDQVVTIYHLLTQISMKPKPSLLWCYKKQLNFSTHRMKRMKKVKKQKDAGLASTTDENNIFDKFVLNTKIRYCYYKESEKILGATFDMLVLQDFEALTPNIIARTVETCASVVCFVLNNIESTKQIYALTMDAHKKLATNFFPEVVPRFNERFFRSLHKNRAALFIDDKLNVITKSKKDKNENQEAQQNSNLNELNKLKNSYSHVLPFGPLVQLTKTFDQASALVDMLDCVKNTQNATISVIAARGRGKSALLGIFVAAVLANNKSQFRQVVVSSPDISNVATVFEFVESGLVALNMSKNADYDMFKDSNNFTYKILLLQTNQLVKFVRPSEINTEGVDMVVIDEAAAIPLPTVKRALDSCRKNSLPIVLSSTVQGYEGTGRALSLKLLNKLKEESNYTSVKLAASIRYSPNDPIEAWLNTFLCLNNQTDNTKNVYVQPENTALFEVNKDLLFTFKNSVSEGILQRIMAIYTSAHYKNSPNDLQLLADCPSHRLYVLMPKIDILTEHTDETIPLFVVLQVAIEGRIDAKNDEFRTSGDMVPWLLTQQFCDEGIGELVGVRVVRIASNEAYMNMGYGSRAVRLLYDYFEKSGDKEEKEKENVPLLVPVEDRLFDYKVDYLSVSFGMNFELFKFWKKNEFYPVYTRLTVNEVTNEHTCTMLRAVDKNNKVWVFKYFEDFRGRFLNNLAYELRSLSASFAYNILCQYKNEKEGEPYRKEQLDLFISQYDVKRMTNYSNNLVDIRLINDLLPEITRLVMLKRLEVQLTVVQQVILVGVGLQKKGFKEVADELNIEGNQALGLANRAVKKVVAALEKVYYE